jgi:hypothetical protein
MVAMDSATDICFKPTKPKASGDVVQAWSSTSVGWQQDSKTVILANDDVHYMWLSISQSRFPWSESGHAFMAMLKVHGSAPGHASARVQSLSRSSPGGALGFVLWQMDVVLLRAVQGRHHHHDRGH